jgi:hypothetical protein
MKRGRIVLLVLLLAVLGGAIAYWRLTAYPPSHGKFAGPSPASPPNINAESSDADTPDGKTRRQLLGTWQDNYRGKRTMTLNADGTGTMDVELSGLDAFLAAPKLHFEMQWSVKEKVLTKKTVGGEPKDKVNLILNTMGDTAVEPIVELTDDRLLLLDKDGETQYDWRRLKPTEPGK